MTKSRFIFLYFTIYAYYEYVYGQGYFSSNRGGNNVAFSSYNPGGSMNNVGLPLADVCRQRCAGVGYCLRRGESETGCYPSTECTYINGTINCPNKPTMFRSGTFCQCNIQYPIRCLTPGSFHICECLTEKEARDCC